jgi:hypothetical protein
MPRNLRLEDLKKAITHAVTVRGAAQRRDERAYVLGIGDLMPLFEDLIEEGHAADALTLVELTLRKMEANWPKVDDSNGGMSEVFKELQALHLGACKAAKPDQKKLAKRLFEWGQTSAYDAFYDAPKVYADVLGTEGMAEMGRLIDAAFAQVPLGMPGADAWERASNARRITTSAARHAEQTKDFDKLIHVLTRNVSTSYRFLEIAEACKRHGRMDLALSWAEKGVGMPFRDGVDPRLKLFLAHLYADEGKIDAAFKLLWTNFEKGSSRDLEAFKEMKVVGEKVGFWMEWRELALAHLREGKGYEGSGSLIKALISEGLIRMAHEEAVKRGCTMHVWTDLAEALADDGDKVLAYETYQGIFGFAMNDYEGPQGRWRVHDTVRKMSGLAERIGKLPDFKAWLEEKKTVFKRRTGFLNDLKKIGL